MPLCKDIANNSVKKLTRSMLVFELIFMEVLLDFKTLCRFGSIVIMLPLFANVLRLGTTNDTKLPLF